MECGMRGKFAHKTNFYYNEIFFNSSFFICWYFFLLKHFLSRSYAHVSIYNIMYSSFVFARIYTKLHYKKRKGVFIAWNKHIYF